ncbi:MAG: phosphonate metabolism transcriptional regulator PhnF [Acetobacteraceae bacterium]|nr:phosphonate metabolism transcriptional regulator PhnF [Acetobacteraceae bacterium]
MTLWRQIASVLEAEIAALPPGTRLATEAELAARFAVNRHTVRRAVEELARRGMIRVEQGRGSFTAEETVEYRLTPRTRFSETIARDRREPSGRLLRIARVPAGEEVAAALGLRRGASLWVVERLGLADGRPLVLGTHYFSASRLPGLGSALAREGGAITRALSASGVADYTRASTRISARMPTPEESALLDHPRARPVLVTDVVNVDPAGQPIEFGRAVYATPRVSLVVEF